MPVITHPAEWPGAAKAALTHKVGPLPVWGWGAVGAGAILAYRMLRTRGSSSSLNVNPAPVASIIPGSLGGSQSGGNGGGGSWTPSAGNPTPDNPTASITPSHATGSTDVAGNLGVSLSPSDQAYWQSKLGPNPVTVDETYDPATLLARWTAISAKGTAGTAYTPEDIRIGLAHAQQQAASAGVTPEQYQQAVTNIGKYGDYAGFANQQDAAYIAAKQAAGIPLGKQYTEAQMSYANKMGLSANTPEAITALAKDPTFWALGGPDWQGAKA